MKIPTLIIDINYLFIQLKECAVTLLMFSLETLFNQFKAIRCLHFGFILFLFYGLSGLVLFALLGYAMSLAFASLLDQCTAEQLRSETFLLKWQRMHALICDTVDRLNSTFGFVLLLWISYIFVNFINLAFYLISANSSSIGLLTLSITVIQQTLRLLLITLVPNRIYKQVL